jgi:hypothetical protein
MYNMLIMTMIFRISIGLCLYMRCQEKCYLEFEPINPPPPPLFLVVRECTLYALGYLDDKNKSLLEAMKDRPTADGLPHELGLMKE